ncbi:phage/plasmid primase, P4 family [Paenibacillus sp. GXUN7292]|uniref:phage/plasmid primase, P4 family n=1 Tax=Paenibacillus sp. GXUN7292 TaxID=3422499 RepID=UPI003D7CDA30
MNQFNIENIPDELKRRNQWVLWKLEKRQNAGKPTKVMYSVNGNKAASNKPETWSSFQTVLDEYHKLPGSYSGIGYVFSEVDPYTGVDLDDCVIEQKLVGGARDIILKLDSYTERSQSGNGVHVLVKAEKPGKKCKNTKAGFEMYDRERFFVVTGDHVAGSPLTIESRQKEIDDLYDRMFSNKKESQQKPALSSTDKEDSHIISLAQKAKNGEKFMRLYRGDWSGYGSQSEADQALCNILAFYTQQPEQVDRLFRGSGLMREKWEREDYATETIRKAVELVEETQINNKAKREDIPTFDIEDKGNAERLVHYFGSQILYCAGAWYIWEGKRWLRDDMKAIKTFGMELAELIDRHEYFPLWDSIDENDQMAILTAQPKDLDPEQRALKARLDALKRQGKLMRTDKGINAALSLAASLRAVQAEELDADQWLLNVNNGTIDLRTGMLLPHNPSMLLTKLAPVDYIPDAPRPLWTSTLYRIFEDEQGQPRMPELFFLKKMLGYCLTGSVTEHAFFIFHGRRGRNGKGVINQAVEAILGDYAQQIPADALLAKRSDGGGASPSIAKIRGSRLVFAKETDRGRRLDEALIKSLTGGDSITARFLHENEFTFRPTFKIILETNYNPHVDGSDDGIWDRIKKLDFLRHFQAHERDKALGEKLQEEYAGILAWMVEGCLMWQHEGLEETADMKAYKEQTRSDGDPVISYADERILFNVEAWVRPKELYDDYEQWTYRNNEHLFKKSEFKIRLQAIADRKNHRIQWNGRDSTGTIRAVRGVGITSAWISDQPFATVAPIEAYRR